ncbi:MAG: hypothetical protein C5B44_04595 [Acidobacteria bacterium]|nr:MAG: hypothetical protein C5B44_04595 [Acidobacteriota bacterium]
MLTPSFRTINSPDRLSQVARGPKIWMNDLLAQLMKYLLFGAPSRENRSITQDTFWRRNETY